MDSHTRPFIVNIYLINTLTFKYILLYKQMKLILRVRNLSGERSYGIYKYSLNGYITMSRIAILQSRLC